MVAGPLHAYYDAIDGEDYDTLARLLAPAFVHHRPDRTIRGRDAFVRFMREERPRHDTVHHIETTFTAEGSEETVAVCGRLTDVEGERLFAFVDVASLEGGRIAAIWTYTA